MGKMLNALRGFVLATVEAIHRPGITTATERDLWISAWCISGFALFFGWQVWIIVSIVLALGWLGGLYLHERSMKAYDPLRLVHDVDEEGIEPSRLEDTGT